MAPWLGVLGLGAGGGILLQASNGGEGSEVVLEANVPPRQQQLQRLAASKPAKRQPGRPFDILVIGGGATGCGIALDAATRCARACALCACAFARARACTPTNDGASTPHGERCRTQGRSLGSTRWRAQPQMQPALHMAPCNTSAKGGGGLPRGGSSASTQVMAHACLRV